MNANDNKIAIVCSLQDEASVNIASELKKIGIPSWANFYEFKEDTIYLPLNEVIEDNIIVLSKHESKSNKKSLTVHSIGNFSKAEFGGIDSKLCGTLPKIKTNYLREINKKKEELELVDFDVCYEVTHHGPFVEKNIVFIEIGSSKKDWEDKRLGKMIAEVIITQTKKENNDLVGIGFGGTHYAPNFTKLVLKKNYSLGHICPVYKLEAINEELINQMVKKTNPDLIILDWKGLKSFKKKIIELCEKTKLPIEKI